MKKKLLVLTVIGLFSLPTYAVAGSCCGQTEPQQTQTQNPGSKVQTGCPAVAPCPATSGATAAMTPGTSAKKPQDQNLSQQPDTSEKKKN
jgi:hypothetical protein